MIFYLQDTLLNRNAAQLLSSESSPDDSPKSSDKKLILVDLENENFFKKKQLSCDQLARNIRKILLESSTDIYLIVQDNGDVPLIVYAQKLAIELRKYLSRRLKVHCITDLNYLKTYISFDAVKAVWRVTGLKNSNAEILLWEGNSLLQWMNDPQKIVNGVNYVWGNH